jgi:hypothetical protein
MSGVHLCRHYFPKMLARGWRRIVFVSSEPALNIPPEPDRRRDRALLSRGHAAELIAEALRYGRRGGEHCRLHRLRASRGDQWGGVAPRWRRPCARSSESGFRKPRVWRRPSAQNSQTLDKDAPIHSAAHHRSKIEDKFNSNWDSGLDCMKVGEHVRFSRGHTFPRPSWRAAS